MKKGFKIFILSFSILSVLSLLLYFMYFSKNKIIQLMTIQQVFDDISKKYSKEIAQNVERIFRLETAHFTSEIYQNTNSAGMLAFNTSFPYGWNEFLQFWGNNPNYKPIGIYTVLNPNTQTNWNYLKFNKFGGFYTLAEFLKNHNNNAGRWYSLVQSEQDYYNDNISNIQITYTA